MKPQERIRTLWSSERSSVWVTFLGGVKCGPMVVKSLDYGCDLWFGRVKTDLVVMVGPHIPPNSLHIRTVPSPFSDICCLNVPWESGETFSDSEFNRTKRHLKDPFKFFFKKMASLMILSVVSAHTHFEGRARWQPGIQSPAPEIVPS